MNKSKIEHVKFYSYHLRKKMAMQVYLPACDRNTPLPVLYFLHGRSGNEDILFDVDIPNSADQLIENGEIQPLIIVCPRIENSRGVNSSLTCKEVMDPYNRVIHTGMYEDYFIKEVIPFTDNNYNTIENRDGRFIGGASAGGYAALHYAFRNPDLFSKVGGHMPALELKLEEEDKSYFKDKGTWEKYDPINIAKNRNDWSDLTIYLDAGNEDEGEFYKGCSVLHEILKNKGANTENNIFPGHHNVAYIKSNIEKYLKFYAR
ncbi:MAG: alpha/beta hydrolase [Marinifilaceae bacterium]